MRQLLTPGPAARSIAAWLTMASLGVTAGWCQEVAAGPPSLAPIPLPDAGRLEPGAQRQLELARQNLDRQLETDIVPIVDLVETYGLLGRLYYVYDFLDLARISFGNARRLQPDNFRWPYYLAALARLDGDWEGARRILEEVLTLRPDDVPSLIRLGEAQLELGRIEEAAETYLEVIESAPELAAGYAGRGQVAYSRGDYEQAIVDLERALVLQPEATSLQHRLGMAYRQAGDLDVARQHLQSNTGGYLRYPDPLIATLGTLVQSRQVHLNAGIAAVRQGDWEAGIEHFRRAVQEDPEDSLAAYNLGLALLRTGERQKGMEWIETSVELDPDFRNGHFNLANLLAEDGRWQEAIHHLEEAHRIDPEDRIAHLELATALTRLGRNQQAIAELEDLLTVHSRDPEALLNLGTLLIEEGRRQDAIGVFHRLLAVGGDPEMQRVGHLQLGSLLEDDGQLEEALDQFRAAVDLDPGSVEAQSSLAAALGRMGYFAEAGEQFSQVISLAPERVDAHFGRAMALMLAEDYPAALRGLEESLASTPDNVALQHALARLLATAPDPGVRDGRRAVQLAQAVMTEQFSLEHAETMAMALAEEGRFDEAVQLQSRVVSEAKRQGDQRVAERARARLERYQREEPCRAPWRDG